MEVNTKSSLKLKGDILEYAEQHPEYPEQLKNAVTSLCDKLFEFCMGTAEKARISTLYTERPVFNTVTITIAIGDGEDGGGEIMEEGSIIIKGWICRDKYLNPCIGSDLLFATEHPTLDEDTKEYVACGPYIPLKREFYPQVTFESEPVPATMVITIDNTR